MAASLQPGEGEGEAKEEGRGGGGKGAKEEHAWCRVAAERERSCCGGTAQQYLGGVHGVYCHTYWVGGVQTPLCDARGWRHNRAQSRGEEGWYYLLPNGM